MKDPYGVRHILLKCTERLMERGSAMKAVSETHLTPGAAASACTLPRSAQGAQDCIVVTERSMRVSACLAGSVLLFQQSGSSAAFRSSLRALIYRKGPLC